ncbi:MAG: hypothetical protein ACJ79M_00590 [Myxococcales bacterium]
MIVTCPVCRGALALGDRNGRHVASEVHYPHADAGGTMRCSPLTRAEWRELTIDAAGLRSAGGGPPSSAGRRSRKTLRILDTAVRAAHPWRKTAE